ncbi:hypothetical protein H4Q26_006910 [Puccinia striiformis f. sp. tritici PST-130]|nr:hypothetical protein H4Q26_006910 [Puccinia striiformis f. sp. tritici PST-130]
MESPMKGIDTTSSCTSEAFDNLFAPLLERTIAPLKRALAQANIRSINPFITHYVVRNVGPKAMGQPSSVKIKAKIKYSGLVLLKGAVAYEEVQIEAAPADSGKEAKPTKKTGKQMWSRNILREHALSQAEKWLYPEVRGDAIKLQYIARSDELNAISNPIKFQQLYAHISKKVAEKWIGDCSAKQAELSKTQEPAMIWIEILQRKDKFMSDCNLIFNKPPPKLTANPDATMLWVTGSGTLCH